VSKTKRFTTYLLLFIVGFLFLKNLLPDVADHNDDNHDEIGHIHFYQIQSKVQKNLNEVIEISDNKKQATNANENCSSGKSVFAYSLSPVEVYKIECPNFTLAFAMVLIIKNNFLTPYLEPRRKPPRLA
jgi:hypothetical protein